MKILLFQLYFILVVIHFVSATSAPSNLANKLAYENPFQVADAPSDFDFWRSAKELGEKAIQYTDDQLKEVAAKYADIEETMHEFKESMATFVGSTEVFRQSKAVLDIRGFDQEEFTQKLAIEIELVLNELKAEFAEPLPVDENERYRQREFAVSAALDKIEDALVRVYRIFGVSELDVRERFGHVKPHLKHVVLVVGNISDNHPELVEVFIYAGVLILPEGWILRHVLSVFGFGPLGPVKGSPAAWAQRFFFRTVIKEGSWFSRLQSAGMKWPSPAGRKIWDWIRG